MLGKLLGLGAAWVFAWVLVGLALLYVAVAYIIYPYVVQPIAAAI